MLKPTSHVYSCVKFLGDEYPDVVPSHICEPRCSQLFINPTDEDFSQLPSSSIEAFLITHTDAWIACRQAGTLITSKWLVMVYPQMQKQLLSEAAGSETHSS